MKRRRALSLASSLALGSGLVVAASACLSLASVHRVRRVVEAKQDIPYLPDGRDEHRLDLYLPLDPSAATDAPTRSTKADGRRALVVFVHGGWWHGGDKAYWTPVTGLYANVGTALAELGIASAVVNYRLFPEAGFDEMIDDLSAALRFVRVNADKMGVDPDAIFLAGHSAGGHLAAYIATHPQTLEHRGLPRSTLAGVVAISGIYDIVQVPLDVSEALRDEVILPLFGERIGRREGLSPLFALSERMTPTLFLVGQRDYPGCVRDFDAAREVAGTHKLGGAQAFFGVVAGNDHDDMVLEIGTEHDDVGPAIAGFVAMRLNGRSAALEPEQRRAPGGRREKPRRPSSMLAQSP
jgi:acetyl esterase/lipase